jgi:hypothetical protein
MIPSPSRHGKQIQSTSAYKHDENRSVLSKLVQQFQNSFEEAKNNPFKYLSIPLSAAIIGYITNWVGVKMLFYPISWKGIPIYRWSGQPLGILGWQGTLFCIH